MPEVASTCLVPSDVAIRKLVLEDEESKGKEKHGRQKDKWADGRINESDHERKDVLRIVIVVLKAPWDRSPLKRARSTGELACCGNNVYHELGPHLSEL